MNKKDIERVKGEAQAANKNKDYNECFSILKKITPKEFIKYSEDKKWIISGNSASCFWNEWLLNNTQYFHELFTSTLAMQLLYNYFSRTKLINETLEKKLAEEYPELYINAVKKNRLFFRDDRIYFLLNNIQLPEYLLIHQDIWEEFHTKELKFWNEIQKQLKIIVKYPVKNILHSLIKTLEELNFKLETRTSKQILGDTYSFFMDMLLRHTAIKEKVITVETESFKIDFFKQLVIENKNLDSAINKCVGYIHNRLYFMLNYGDNYCYNDNITPQYIYESVYFTEKPITYYNWKKDEVRYTLMEALYYKEGDDIVHTELVNNPDFQIKSRTKEDYNDNKELAQRLNGILLALRDLKLDTFFYGKKEKENMLVDEIIGPTFAFSYNKYIRYEKQMNELKQNSLFVGSWLLEYAHLVHENPTLEILPFIYMSKQEYYGLNGNDVNNISKNITDHIVNLFSVEIEGETFNRFNVSYSVFLTPFIVLGTHLFSPVSFFVAFSSLYTHINRLLNYKAEKTGKAVETELCNILKKHKLNVIRTDDLNKPMDGDADLIIYNEDEVLLMQVKRTKIRIGFKSQYNEYIKIDNHAANQLNEAETFLKRKNKIFKIGNRKVKKWIVSNSFEKVNTIINGCLKVNYLELLMFLNNKEGMTFKTLSDFITFNEADSYFKTIVNKIEVFQETFKIKEINEYVQPVFHFNTNKASKYQHYYDKGLKLHTEGNLKAAIKTFKKMLKLEENDVNVHGAIANVYADIQDYESANNHFDKALKLLPKDPFILWNYIIFIFENDKPYKGLSCCLDTIKTYPLIDAFKANFLHLFETAKDNKLLTKEEIQTLERMRKEIEKQ